MSEHSTCAGNRCPHCWEEGRRHGQQRIVELLQENQRFHKVVSNLQTAVGDLEQKLTDLREAAGKVPKPRIEVRQCSACNAVLDLTRPVEGGAFIWVGHKVDCWWENLCAAIERSR